MYIENQTAEQIVHRAIEAACKLSPMCALPIHIENL